MSRQAHVEQARVLRGVVSRLNNTNSKLPLQLVETARRSIPDICQCKTILASAEDQLKAANVDTSVVVHSFKTKLSSLLQDKSPSARLAAVVLIKATVHIGGYEVLHKNGAVWARALLSNLTRPGASSTKRLIIIVLVQIYRATHNLPNLAREVTTPTLKDFIPACIGLMSTKKSEGRPATTDLRAPLLADVLQAFIRLLPGHPSVFRPFTKSLSELCGRVISASSSGDVVVATTVRSETQALAQRLLALISRCAARSGSGDDWGRCVRLLREHIVHTADEVFRSVVETINPDAISIRPQTMTKKKPDQQPAGEIVDDLHLSSWVGLNAGVERLVSLLQTLQAFIAVQGPAASTYILPVDTILNLVERVMNVFPGQRPGDLASVSANTETTRDERELLFLRSSRIQTEAMGVLIVLCQRLGSTSVSIATGALEYLAWCFGPGVPNDRLRASYYEATTSVLQICGPALTTPLVQNLARILRAAASDICSRSSSSNPSSSSSSSNAGKNSADAYLTVKSAPATVLSLGPAHEPAKRLFTAVLTHVPAESIPNALRNLIDQTVVLTREEDAMLASVLNMAAGKAGTPASYSIAPFLAREHAGELRTEAFLKPRLPGISRRPRAGADEEEEEGLEDERGKEAMGQGGSAGFGPSGFGPGPAHEDAEMEAETETGTGTTAPERRVVTETVLRSTPKISPFAASATVPRTPLSSAVEGPLSPKRARDDGESTAAEPKRVKLATFEAAAGPTAVSVIEESRQSGGHHVVGGDDDEGSDSDGSMPSIHMDQMSDDDEDEDEDVDDE